MERDAASAVVRLSRHERRSSRDEVRPHCVGSSRSNAYIGGGGGAFIDGIIGEGIEALACLSRF
jgi:hypothetical protein